MSYPFFTGKPVSLKDPIDNTDNRSPNNTTNNSEFTPMSSLRNNVDNIGSKSDTPTNTSTTTGTNNNNNSSNNNASGNFPYQSLHFHNPSNTSTKSNVSPTNSTPVSRTKSQKARLENVHYQNFLSDWKRSQPDNCCVCLDSLPGVNNDLVFCAHPECDVCVHQECYGILEVPSANELWYCDKCQHPDREKLCCKLCPQKGGALKPIRDMSCWVHVVCALWWPQVQINDDRGILEIVNVDNIPREAYQRVCYLCENAQDSHYGASVICQAPKCNKTVHITCAQRWDLLEECTDMAQLAPDQEPYYIYCKDHGFRDTPKVNPWAEWAYKKTVYYENMCKNEMEYAPSVNTTETSFNPPSLPRRHSIQFNGIMLPPISSITPLEPVAETGTTPDLKNESFPSPNLSTFTELPGFVKNITTLYNLYEQDRSEFIQQCDQIKNTNHTHINRASSQLYNLSSRVTSVQHHQSVLEQTNRNLRMEVNELKYALLNLCSLKSLRLIQKIIGRPKDGLEFYPHQDRLLDYFLQVGRHVLESTSDEASNNPSQPVSCICGVCSVIVDFSTLCITCQSCGSWYHINCIPAPGRPRDCTALWTCAPCLRVEPSPPAPQPMSLSGTNEIPSDHSPQLTMNTSPNQLHMSQQMHQKHHQINKNMNLKQPPKPNSKLQGPSNNGNTLQFKQEHPSSGKTQTYPVQSEGWPIADSEVDSTGNPQTIKPYKQAPRFEGDLYTPVWVRGLGKSKEGLCPHCTDRPVWLKIKISAYWYHLNYNHGISSITGAKFAPPLEYRINPNTEIREALCHKCHNWIPSESARNKPVNVEEIYWWKHAQKCHN